MSKVYLDTNYLFGLFRHDEQAPDREFEAWRARVEAEVGDESAIVSDLVIDEIVYRLILAWLRDSGDQTPLVTYRRSPAIVLKRMKTKLSALWRALDRLDLEWVRGRPASLHIAQSLITDTGLSPRDAFHAAYAIDNQCVWIVSSDDDFDGVARINRFGPQ